MLLLHLWMYVSISIIEPKQAKLAKKLMNLCCNARGYVMYVIKGLFAAFEYYMNEKGCFESASKDQFLDLPEMA